jgi:type VI secretion system secreted protein Hcp
MPTPAFLTVTGNTQGEIEGSCTIKGHEKTMLIQALDHTIEIPKSPQTGLPTGKRIHGPLTLVKEIDKASPKLFQALTSGEQLSDVKLSYYRISPAGKEELYYTVELKNAIITHMKKFFPNCLDPVSKTIGHMEEVAFTYETIIETWTPDGIEAQDSWNAPKA